jgi:hypothetical protein
MVGFTHQNQGVVGFTPPSPRSFPVKIGISCLTLSVKIGYNVRMLGDILSFVLRIGLVVALWAFVWKFVEPRTQLMRLLRAALLVFGLLGIWAVLKIAGTN